jgi:hypothetical protein
MKPILKAVSIVLVAMITPVLIADEPGDSGTAGNEPIVKTAEHRILFGDKILASRHVTPIMIDDELNAFRNEPKESNLGQIGVDLEILSFTGTSQDRRTVLQLWLKAIDAINRVLELPKQKANPCFYGNFGFGTAEAMEKFRREHEEACKKLEYEEYSPLQRTCLWYIDECIRDASKYIRMKYTSKQSDVKDVYHLIETLVSSNERREQLKALLRTK